jgi:hypothetical protein
MRQVVINEGVRTGIVLAGCVVVLAYVGLTPVFSSVPEAPLVLVTLSLPVVTFAIAGARAGHLSGTWVAGAYAGAMIGAIGGGVAGLAYVFFGKPVLNIAVGVIIGAIAGGVVGAASAWSVLRRTQ